MESLKKDSYPDYNVSVRVVDYEQVFISIQIKEAKKDVVELCEEVYSTVNEILEKYDAIIIHERVFGNKSYYTKIKDVRESLYSNDLNTTTAFSLLEGDPHWGVGIAGMSIRGIITKDSAAEIENVVVNGEICGRLWKNKNSDYMILNNIHGLVNNDDNYYDQTINMFEKVNEIIKNKGFEFKDIVRTWIYLNDILKQYDEFNLARNKKFKDFKLIPGEIEGDSFEEVFMPASTGIDCDNIFGSAGVMDVLAVKKKNKDVEIRNETGVVQKAAYRYGSAFSRAMVVKDKKNKFMYLSGTASINDQGETVFLDDIEKQIKKTGEVINALLKSEGLNVDDIYEGTVFLKKPEYYGAFVKYCINEKWSHLPFIITVADVCRDDLLFEIDATIGK